MDCRIRNLEVKKVVLFLYDFTKQAKVKEYERQIDQMVYKLYGLTDEEINIAKKRKKR